jgi:hypothetical protein
MTVFLYVHVEAETVNTVNERPFLFVQGPTILVTAFVNQRIPEQEQKFNFTLLWSGLN